MLLTTTQVARIVGVHRRTVLRWCNRSVHGVGGIETRLTKGRGGNAGKIYAIKKSEALRIKSERSK